MSLNHSLNFLVNFSLIPFASLFCNIKLVLVIHRSVKSLILVLTLHPCKIAKTTWKKIIAIALNYTKKDGNLLLPPSQKPSQTCLVLHIIQNLMFWKPQKSPKILFHLQSQALEAQPFLDCLTSQSLKTWGDFTWSCALAKIGKITKCHVKCMLNI